MSEEQVVIALKTHYVYELFNIKTGEVFYVGKGSEERISDHEREAENVKDLMRKDKHQMIIDLKKSSNYGQRVIGRYNTELEAFAVESTLIHWMYGFESLTNIQRGKGSDTIRSQSTPSEVLDAIDVPQKVKESDGEYSRKHSGDRDKNEIVKHMQEVKSYFEKACGISLSEIDDSDARFTRLFYDYNQARLAIYSGHSSTKKLTILVESIDGSGFSRILLRKICEASDEQLTPKAGGTYAKLEGVKAMGLGLELIEAFKATQNALEQGINDAA